MGRWRLLLSSLVRAMPAQVGRRGLGEWANRRVLQSLLDGYRGSAMLYVAAKLGIADLLAEQPRTSHELARSLAADGPSLHRFLRGLVAFGICSEEQDGSFGLTSLGTWLQDAKPGSLRGQAIRNGELYAAWGSLLHTVITGETAFAHVFEMDVWDYRRRVPELDEYFNRAFRESAVRVAHELLAAYDFSGIRTIADIGGGYGVLLAVILQNTPDLVGILFDQGHVIEKAAAHLKEAGISERCLAVGGDLLAHVPEGADRYILKSVIHDWNDKQSEQILENCRKALKEEGKLLLVERIMPARAKQDPALVMLDLRMLTVTGGRERNESEFRALFEAAGLTVTQIIRLRSGFSIIEGMPAKLSIS
jgi:SAM-dependent methyltransferase